MIVSGGENVASREVESVLLTHPAVADVAVIAVPDERWGEAVHAVVVVAPGESRGPRRARWRTATAGSPGSRCRAASR